MRLFGVTGWKNAGKTGLIERLVIDLVGRGYSVSTVKHAHHTFDMDRPGKDSHRHRLAGATEVLLASRNRWALMHESRGEDEPPLEALLARLTPVDLVLVEGYKRDAHPKVEAFRAATGNPLIASDDPTVRAVASDVPLAGLGVPVFDLDDTAGVADFILAEVGLPQRRRVERFDTFVMLDWSGGGDTGPTPTTDAIWAAVAPGSEKPAYLRNRTVALEWLVRILDDEIAAGRRVLVGLDFPFACPRGFSEIVTGRADPLALWDWYAAELSEGDNRFALAARINRMFPGTGPFWFHFAKNDLPDLPKRKNQRHGHGMPESRHVETRAAGTFTCWQLGGAGSVGSQAITGMATLSRLRARLGANVAVWPFEAPGAPVVLAEVWPSLLAAEVRAAMTGDAIKDAVQVRLLAATFAGMQAAGTLDAALAALDGPVAEGWILGVGAEPALKAAAKAALRRLPESNGGDR